MNRFLMTSLFALALSAPVMAQTGALPVDGPSKFDAVPADAVSPFGGLSLTPTRLVLEPGSTLGQITLYNSGGETVTYRVEDVELQAMSEGGYAPIEEGVTAPEWAASRYLRYAPRQVTLGAGERQVVKVISRAPRDLPAGEFRSHLRFSSIPTVAPVDEKENPVNRDGDNTVEVKVGLEYRITIPVILRTGQGTGGTEIEAASLEANPDSEGSVVKVTLNKTGAWADHGTLRALDENGEEVGLLRGVSVLPPLKSRVVRIPVEVGARPAKIIFEKNDQAGEVIASANIG